MDTDWVWCGGSHGEDPIATGHPATTRFAKAGPPGKEARPSPVPIYWICVLRTYGVVAGWVTAMLKRSRVVPLGNVTDDTALVGSMGSS